MKVIAIVKEWIEIPDYQLEHNPDSADIKYISPWTIKDEYIDDYLEDDECIRIEDMDGNTMAEI